MEDREWNELCDFMEAGFKKIDETNQRISEGLKKAHELARIIDDLDFENEGEGGILERQPEGAMFEQAVDVAIGACSDPNVVNSGVCLDCSEIVAGVWQDGLAHACEFCDGKRVFNTFTVAHAHIDGTLSELVKENEKKGNQ